jgi:four helix bundle protein
MSLAHHSLVAWQRADDLFIRLHQLSLKAFPAYERFELGSQLRRAAFSVAVNIVEGFAHLPGRARLNVLKVSHASLAEVGYCIHVARRLEYISESVANELEIQVKEVGAPLAGLIRSARLKLAAATGSAVVVIGSLIMRLA